MYRTVIPQATTLKKSEIAKHVFISMKLYKPNLKSDFQLS